MVFLLTEAWTCLNPCIPCVIIILHICEHTYSQILSETTIVGAHHGAHENRLRESMAFRSTSKFLPGLRLVLGSLLFITDKCKYLSLQELESLEVTESGTGRLPPAPV
jgi:hypothetical protein